MPADTIRRCAFKVPKNDKYQCQKAGDKHQLHVNLWYCRFHDHHAKDRCQALIEWAGKGAQCQQLGVWDEEHGMKLCDWHGLKSRGDEWAQAQDVPVGEVAMMTKELEMLGVKKEDDVLSPLSNSTLSSRDQLEDSRTDVQPGSSSHARRISIGLESEKLPSPSLPDEEDLIKHVELRNDTNDDTETSPPKTNTAEAHGTSISTPPPNPTTLAVPPPNSHPSTTHFTPRRTQHTRTDSLDPLTHPATPPRPTALYIQCCICLEKHSEEVMRTVAACRHQYRELCLRKAGKGGGRRQYNCTGCGEWVRARTELNVD